MSDSRKERDERVTAAEYALRLLNGDDQQAAATRAAIEPEFAAEIARWQARLAPLYDEIEPVAVPQGLWDRIQERTTGRSAANDNVSALRRRLVAWKTVAGTMTALAASLVLFVLVEPRTMVVPQPQAAAPQRAGAPMVAILADQGSNKAVASWDPGAKQLVLAVTGDMKVGPQQSPELWVILPGAKPRSLGIMPEGKQAHLRLADALAQLLKGGATIAVSVEPHGGSPTGAPTGPVIASGALVQA